MGLLRTTIRGTRRANRQLRCNRRRYGRYQHNINDPATRFLIALGAIVMLIMGVPAAAGIAQSLTSNTVVTTLAALAALGVVVVMIYIVVTGGPKHP